MCSELVQWKGEVIGRARGLVGFWFDTETDSPPTCHVFLHSLLKENSGVFKGG